jgi:acyl transferase domain-containing protein
MDKKRKVFEDCTGWVKGLEIDWNRIYDHSKPKRISLPTYPFLKEKYWVGKSGSGRMKSQAV